MALLRDLMGPAARRLGDAPGVREVEFAAITVSDAIRRDMRAAAAQARGARVVLGIGSEIVLDALALVRVAARLRHRA